MSALSPIEIVERLPWYRRIAAEKVLRDHMETETRYREHCDGCDLDDCDGHSETDRYIVINTSLLTDLIDALGLVPAEATPPLMGEGARIAITHSNGLPSEHLIWKRGRWVTDTEATPPVAAHTGKE